MTEIHISIPRKFGFVRWTTRRRRFLPTAWTDITSPKRRLFFLHCATFHPKPAATVEILRGVLDVPKTEFLGMSDVDIAAMSERLEWLFEPPSATPIVESFTHKDTNYFLLKPDFDNGTAFEFALADEYYNEWATNRDDADALILMVAALVRAHAPNAPTLDKEVVEKRAVLLADLPVEIIIAVLRYFEAVKKDVHEIGQQVGLFDPPKEENEAESETDTTIHFGWWTAFRSIAKQPVFGDFNGVCRAFFMDVLSFMIEEKQRNDAQEKAYKKASETK
jgi:hypothetical protein